MPDDRVATLMAAHDATIREHEFFREIFGVIRGDGSAGRRATVT
jgi:hypothetical protein